MSVLEKLFHRSAEQRENAIDAYNELVATIAAGNDALDPSEVEGLLKDAGKTPADLSHDVSHQQSRNGYRAQIAEAADVKRELPEIERQIEQAHAKLEEAKRTFNATVAPLKWRRQQIDDLQSQVQAMKQHLRECAPKEQRDRLNALRSQKNALDNRINGLTNSGASNNRDELSQAMSQRSEISAQIDAMVRKMEGA